MSSLNKRAAKISSAVRNAVNSPLKRRLNLAPDMMTFTQSLTLRNERDSIKVKKIPLFRGIMSWSLIKDCNVIMSY